MGYQWKVTYIFAGIDHPAPTNPVAGQVTERLQPERSWGGSVNRHTAGGGVAPLTVTTRDSWHRTSPVLAVSLRDLISGERTHLISLSSCFLSGDSCAVKTLTK